MKTNITKSNTKIIAVTILTSHNQENLYEIGITQSIEEQISKLAINAAQSGLDGIVCSAIDIKNMSHLLPENFLFVTPGIRLEKIATDDQKRISSPQSAIEFGSDILIIGRPITTSKNPEERLHDIIEGIKN